MGIAVRVAGLTLEVRMFDRPARWLRPLATTCLFGIVLFAQPGGERLALGVGYAGTGAANSGLDHVVPMFPGALDGVRQGFVRIVNHSPRAGEVQVEAYDDDGTRFGPVTLDIDADATVHFNSGDLEDGNAAKGLAVGTGPGVGDWWLALSSDLDIEVLSYIRTPGDGFLTSMHDVVPPDADGDYRVAIFNPGSNADQVSRLRLVNAGEQTAEVTITGVDDRGASPGSDVRVSVPAGAARTLAADELESGAGLQGALGDGTGKWALRVASDTPVLVMSLLQSPTGHLTNLSTAPDNVDAGTRTVPLFPAASDPFGRQGFVRVINRSTEAGDVTVAAFDDTDRDFGSVTLSLDANATAHFNSDDLEVGNAAKGLSGSTGAGAGDWRLELSSDLDIEVLAYIRTTSDGFLTAMHDTVPREGDRHRVAIFNPGSNADQVSRLRLVNAGNDPAEVTVAGIDDRGASSSGGSVAVSVPAGTSRTLTAHELEAGADGFDGELGNGAGKWQLVVESGQPVIVMSLLSSPTGHLTNLSTAPAANFAPAEAAAFDDRVLGKRIVGANPANHVDLLADRRFRETEDGQTYEGSYTYSRTGTNAATVVLSYDDGDTCTYTLAFASRTGGSLSFTCDDGAAGESTWLLVETPPVGGSADGYCRPGGVVERGSSCTIYETAFRFEVESDGTSCLRAGGFTSCAGSAQTFRNTTINGVTITLVAQRNANASWTIEDVDPKPAGSGTEGPDLVVGSPSVDDSTPLTDASFTLTATVRNRGSDPAPATTVRYYRSGNARISTGDVEVGSAGTAALAAAETREHSTALTAPAEAGTYYYGACVDAVDSEADTGNNCSNAVRVTVSAPEMLAPADMAAFDDRFVGKRVVGDNSANYTDFVSAGRFRETEGMESYDGGYTYAKNGATTGTVVFNYDDGDTCTSRITFVSHTTGSLSFTCNDGNSGASSWRLTDIPGTDGGGNRPLEMESFDLDPDNRYPRGITFANGRFYVVDDHYPASKVFAYQANGQRDSASDFDLDSNNGSPEGITFANDRFYVADGYPGRKVYVYHASGQPDSASDFDLDSENSSPEGITFANDRFYVIDLYDGKAFAYEASGQRDSDSDFDLDTENRYPSGITFANDTFYVIGELRGEADNKVYAYRADGERDSASDFNLDSDNRNRSGITFANDRFYVIDDSAKKVHVIDSSAHRLPDLALTSASVSDTTPTSGESFVFRATVRNRGTLASAATTLRYYRSDDRAISASDTEVGTEAVAALSPAETISGMLSLTTPSTAGTYYYGACIEPVSGESDTANNCSSAVVVTVRPDLTVRSSVSETTLTVDESFVLTATVRNRGNIASAPTTLRYYRSDDRSLSESDTALGTEAVSAIEPNQSVSRMLSLTAPETSGTYYYGACVDYMSGESNSRNNCSAVQVTVRAILPDLTVESPSVSDSTPASGDSFEFTVTVRNQGLSASTGTTIRYYRSENRTVSSSDTEVSTAVVGALAVDESVSATVSLPAPATEGTYYYGACVDSVSGGEISTENNCSTAVVVFGGGPFPVYDLDISRTVLHAPGVVVLGQTEITMTVDVTNLGPNASRPARLRFGNTYYLTIPVLDPDETVTFERQTVGVATLGTTTYRVCIVEAPGEENTDNNCAARSVTYRLGSAAPGR